MELTERQKEAVNELEKNLQIIACAGSGKTEVITRRIANILISKPDVRPSEIVAFTFTRKAAESMKRRITSALIESNYDVTGTEEMYVGTIHGFCQNLLEESGSRFSDVQILDSVRNHLFCQRYASDCGMTDLGIKGYFHNTGTFLSCIDKMACEYDYAEEWEKSEREGFEKYRSCLQEHGYIDFQSLIFETLELAGHDEEFMSNFRKVRYLVVDEYQDIDDLQEKLISLFYEAGANICVVGDDDQTIYQFRGSNADNMIGFAQRYENVRQVRMEENFRSLPQIIDIADTVIKNNTDRLDKRMFSSKPVTSECTIEACNFDSELYQYERIASEIKQYAENGKRYSDIAILVRKGKYIAQICSQLQKKGIPYRTNNAERYFEGEHYLKLRETIDLLIEPDRQKMVDCWGENADENSLKLAFRHIRRISRSGGTGQAVKLSDCIREIVKVLGLLDKERYPGSALRWEVSVESFCSILDDLNEIYSDCQLSFRLTKAVCFLDNYAADEYRYHDFVENQDNEDKVQIMTVHKSKGLEFDTVFLPDMEMGNFPAGNIGGRQFYHVLGDYFREKKDKYSSDEDDERKLFYVAVTRAKINLHMYYALDRKPLSIFVKEADNSRYINVPDEDINYIPPSNKSGGLSGMHSCSDGSRQKFEEEREARRKYYNQARALKGKLMDYYGSAMHSGLKAAGADLIRVSSMDADEVFAEARRQGFI